TDNLKYLRLKEERDSKQDDFKAVSENQARAKQRLEESKVKERELEVAHYLARRKVQIRQMEQWQKEIEAIEGSLEMKERQEVIQGAKQELRIQWEQVYQLWQAQILFFSGRQQSQAAEEKVLRKGREEFLLELGRLDGKIQELTALIRQYTEDLGVFASRHGQEAAHSPAAALQRMLIAARSIAENILALNEKRKSAEEEKLILHTKHTRLTEKLLGADTQAEELTERIEAQMNKESQLWSQLVVLLEMYEEHQLHGTTALFEAKSLIQERFIRRLDDAEQQTKRLRRDYYNQLLDVELQQEAYWLPNSDILTVKDALDALKISSMTG
ncbi:hypothetical protein KC345_g11882, partial [Hortaea werneckii]